MSGKEAIKFMRGRIISIHPKITRQKLKVLATIQSKSEGLLQAFMPERELAALVPRCILLADKRQAPAQLLSTITVMIKRMALARTVRIWKYREHYYFSFISWGEVRFVDE
jgi:hypothetical protein